MFEQLLTSDSAGDSVLDNYNWVSTGGFDLTNLGIQATCVSHEGVGYIFGGRVGLSLAARNVAFKVTLGKMEALTPMPANTILSGGKAVGDKIYIIGGGTSLSVGTETKTLYIYDIPTNSWSTGADCPAYLVAAATCVVGTDIYAWGGCRYMDASTLQSTLYKYDTVTNTWTTLSSNPSGGAYCVEMDHYKGKIFILFGQLHENGTYSPNHYVYDIATDSWSILSYSGPGTPGRTCIGVRVDENNYLIVGGRTTYAYGTTDTIIFNFKSRKFKALKNELVQKSFNALVKVDNVFYNLTGYSGSEVKSAEIFR